MDYEKKLNVLAGFAEHRLYVLDALDHATVQKKKQPAKANWVFDNPFYIILNVAIGGDWPGSPDSSTVFPQNMYIDYVRIYQ